MSFVVAIILGLTTAAGLAAFVWAFIERDNYKNNTDSIVAEAVETAKAEQNAINKAAFLEEEKRPYRAFTAPSDFGRVSFNYPKTWAAFNYANSSSSYSVYFYPLVVPPITTDTAYALRLDVSNRAYDGVIKSFESPASRGEVTVRPFTTTKDGLSGVRVDGQLSRAINGSAVIFKVRDKTLTVQVDSQEFMGDFNNIILPSLTFIP